MWLNCFGQLWALIAVQIFMDDFVTMPSVCVSLGHRQVVVHSVVVNMLQLHQQPLRRGSDFN